MALSEMEAEIIYGKGGSARNAVHTFIAANITLSKFWNGVYYENIFFTRGFDNGYLEVLVMNPSANEGVKDSAGVDSYYWYGYKDRKVMMYESVHLGKKPEELIKTFTRYVKFTDSWETPWWNFLFMPGHPN